MGMRVRGLDAAVEFQAARSAWSGASGGGGVAPTSTCNGARHHRQQADADRVRDAAADHVGLEVADGDALEAARAAVAQAGGQPIGAVYDGELTRNRPRRLRPRPRRPCLQACSAGWRPWRRRLLAPADPLRARLHQGPQPGPTGRCLAGPAYGFVFSGPRMGRTASWWRSDAVHHGMAFSGAPASGSSTTPGRCPTSTRSAPSADRLAAAGQKLSLGAEPPQPRTRPSSTPRTPTGRWSSAAPSRDLAGGDAPARRLRGETLARPLRRDQPVARTAAAALPACRPPDRQRQPAGVAAIEVERARGADRPGR